jgi:hypothetical protein
MPSQKYPEERFTNFLDISQSNQVDNQNYSSQGFSSESF